MQLEFISNTGCFLEHGGTVIGMDLWLTQGAFEGAWFHFPPLRPTKFSVEDCDYIYISHIHPDHCDFLTLSRARRDTTFIVPNYFDHLLARKLKAFGFENIISLAPEERATLPCGAEVKLFDQFVNNLFAEADFGNLIDSALLIEWDGRTILNCNDNKPDLAAAHRLAANHPNIDYLMLQHSASGPYPACFRNLTLAEKRAAAAKHQRDFIAHFVALVDIINPRFASPCAAEYVIVGRGYEKNPYIGIAAAADAAEAVNNRDPSVKSGSKAIQLDCGTILDIDTGELSGLPVRCLSPEERDAFAAARKDIPYSCDWESACTDPAEFDVLMERACHHIWEKQKRLNWTRDLNIYITVDERPAYAFNFARDGVQRLVHDSAERTEPYLECFLTRQLLYSIFTRKSHWNNAEGGLLIEFHRQPDIYVPEAHTLLSFLHDPARPDLSGQMMDQKK